MTPTRFLASCTLAFSALLPAVSAQAAGYPDHPIRLIVPTSPGSTADVVARVVAENLGKALAQPLIVENLAGAAGIPGTRQLVAAKPDGYTLAIVSSNHAINPSLYKSMPYDSVKDITPISVIGTTPLVVVVAENSPYRTIGDLLAAARAQPGKINYGSSGNGSVLHLAGELLKSKAGVSMMHIPYRGGNALITDVMSGQIQVAFWRCRRCWPRCRPASCAPWPSARPRAWRRCPTCRRWTSRGEGLFLRRLDFADRARQAARRYCADAASRHAANHGVFRRAEHAVAAGLCGAGKQRRAGGADIECGNPQEPGAGQGGGGDA